MQKGVLMAPLVDGRKAQLGAPALGMYRPRSTQTKYTIVSPISPAEAWAKSLD